MTALAYQAATAQPATTSRCVIFGG